MKSPVIAALAAVLALLPPTFAKAPAGKQQASVEQTSQGARERRAVSLPVRRAADQLRAPAGHRTGPRRAGRQDHVASCLPPHRQQGIDRGGALGQHRGRRARRPLVRVPGGQGPQGRLATYAPDTFFRWMASPAIDRMGNIGIGYSFGGSPHFAGQRFAGRLAADPPGVLTLRETVVAEGEASQINTLRWEDYTTTAMDPSDDCTIWYVGDYLKKGAASYSTKIASVRMPGCDGSRR